MSRLALAILYTRPPSASREKIQKRAPSVEAPQLLRRGALAVAGACVGVSLFGYHLGSSTRRCKPWRRRWA